MNGKQKEDILVLLDGSAYLYRAYHALPPLKNAKGENTGAIHGFLKALNKIMTELIPKRENTQDTLNIIFTNKLTCTFDENDFRYHARAWVGSNPTIISTTGIIEAPAKPKQYYIDLITNFSKESIKEVKKKYKGEFLEYKDIRLPEIIEGYLLQTIFYYETGDAFCDNNQCRLFNAHWQKDLFNTQIENKKMCEKHENILTKMKTNIS